ncbi:MAG: M28 family peptidase [Sulfolobus sp.]
MLGEEIFSLGEVIHGSKKEKEVLRLIENSLPLKARKVEITTREWMIKNFSFKINGKEVKASLLPYTNGYVKGRVGKDVKVLEMPDHPFKINSMYEEFSKSFSAIIFYDNGKLRRISVRGEKPALFSSILPKEGDLVEIEAESELISTTSYNYEFELQPGESYIVLGAHVDHWLTGYHDNIFSIELLFSMIKELKGLRHGVKLVFFSSEEGPRCCTGSYQHDKRDTFIMISLDALYPNRVVFSSTPDLWKFSKYFNLKRVEMPTPYSDHFPYVVEGYPALVLYNDDLIPFYHSDADLPVEGDLEYLQNLQTSLLRFIKEVDKLSNEELVKEFIKYAKSKGVEVKERRGSIIPYGLTSKFRGEL